MIKILQFIDGKLVEPASGRYFDDVDPSVGAPYALVPDGDAEDINRAVAAAKAAFPAWSETAAAERSRVLLAIADGIEREIDELARVESIDNGKPVTLARSSDMPRYMSASPFPGHKGKRLHQLALPIHARPPFQPPGLGRSRHLITCCLPHTRPGVNEYGLDVA
jgi:acyl-CoA reductase-like NAD-dependent aldehyde dehydrogenase